MPVLAPGILYAIVFLLCTNGVTGIMWYVTKKDGEAYKAQVAVERAEAEAAHARKLVAAAAVNNSLTAELSRKDQEMAAALEEKSHEIKRLTVGRRCFDARVVRVLNASVPAQPGLSEASPSALREDAAFATDTDVGGWIAVAQRQYEQCRARIDAIATFYEANP